jgi:hypothetical protein
MIEIVRTVMKLFGTKEIADNMERSLVKLAELTFP